MIYWIYALQKITHFYRVPVPRLRLAFFVLLPCLLVVLSLAGPDWQAPGHQRQFARPGESQSTPATGAAQPEPAAWAAHSPAAGAPLRLLLLEHQEVSKNERALLVRFAAERRLQLRWQEVGDARELFTALQEGRGDLALSRGLSIPAHLEDELGLTLPWGMSQQQVISRSDTGRIRSRDDLATRQVALKVSSPVWKSLSRQAKRHAAMSILEIPETEPAEETLARVASGQYDVTVLDNLTAEELLPSFLNLEVAFNASEASMSAWALRKSEEDLAAELDNFLNKQYLQSQIHRSYHDDLPQLQKKKLLRLITYRGPVNYFLKRGRLKGFEHDLLKRFAQNRNMRLDVVLAESHDEMRRLLLEGRGDVIAASVPGAVYTGLPDIALTQGYNHSAPIVIGRSKDTPLVDARELAGRRIVLAATSPYRQLLQRLKHSGVDIDIVQAPTEQGLEQVLFHVANGDYDLTLVGSHELKAQFSRQINIRAHFALSEPLPQVWAVRDDSRLLLNALNEYIAREFRKGFYNVLYSKYIEEPRNTLGDIQLVASAERLSPYDDIVLKYSKDYGFDWRLIVAQMYQESHFNPGAVSYSGARGLMQLIPATADLLGIEDSHDPDSSIQAGVRYMDYLRDKFSDEAMLEDRIWFSLAAYNAGYSRVQRARRLAERMGLDQNRWFDNVEKAMLALARPYWKDGEVVRHCRCGQAVVYVREIRTLYNNYVQLRPLIRERVKTGRLSQDI